ncbi:MAG TPA: hypothetical protein ENJ29_02530 [Bacteroidetes bacterium]|nr:hypothetical protein [Bacteroidota bacterium]
MAKKITVREYDRRAEELLKRIRAEAKPFPDDSDAAKEKRRKRAEKDFLWFCKTYLPHHFEDPWEKPDRELTKKQNIWNKINLVMAFRGFGKSTRLIIGYGLWVTLFQKTRYIPVISDSEDQATDLMMPVKVELEANARIKQDFGKLQSHDWAEDAFVTTTGIKWQSFGWRTKIRGRRYLQHRPGIAFVDDLENDENVRNAKQVKNRRDYILKTLVPAMGKRWQIWFLATRLARFCVAGELEKNPVVEKFILPAEDEKGRPTCPKRFPKARLQQLRKLIGVIAYSQEYLLRIISDETSTFQDEWLVWMPRPAEKYKRIVSFLDPSAGGRSTNDYKALVTVGWTGEYYDVLNCWERKTSTDHMLRATYNRYNELRPHYIGLEINGFQSLLKREFQRAAKKFGFQLPIKPVVQKENKELRIERLSPLVESGLIRFVEGAGDIDLLIEQLLDFPDAAHDDGPDALAGAIEILEKIAGRNAEVDISTL